MRSTERCASQKDEATPLELPTDNVGTAALQYSRQHGTVVSASSDCATQETPSPIAV